MRPRSDDKENSRVRRPLRVAAQISDLSLDYLAGRVSTAELRQRLEGLWTMEVVGKRLSDVDIKILLQLVLLEVSIRRKAGDFSGIRELIDLFCSHPEHHREDPITLAGLIHTKAEAFLHEGHLTQAVREYRKVLLDADSRTKRFLRKVLAGALCDYCAGREAQEAPVEIVELAVTAAQLFQRPALAKRLSEGRLCCGDVLGLMRPYTVPGV